MKSRSVGACPVKPGMEGTICPSRKKLNNYILASLLLHHFQSMRGKLKRGLSNPQSYFRLLSLYGLRPPPPPDTGPLDLSISKKAKPLGTPSVKAPKNSSEKELIWRPCCTQALSDKKGEKREWFPVVRKSPPEGEKPKFFPLSEGGSGERKFPWMNPLNHIFLQEKNSCEGDDTEAKKELPPPDKKTPDSSSVSSSHSKYEKGGATPALKPTVTNPFKITPSNSWPIDTTEQHSKPILAPPKFGSNVNSGFGKFGCSGSSMPTSKGSSPLAPSTLSASSTSNETPKSTFKLKPPVLGSSVGASSTPFSLKRPASKVESEGGADSSSPIKGSPGHSESPPDAKRVRTSPSLDRATGGLPDSVPSVVVDGKNGSGVSSSTSSSERKRSSSPSSMSTGSRAVPTFVPLSNTTMSTTMEASSTEESPSRVNGVGATSPPLSSKVGNAGFIFGQNLENRISGVSSTSGSCAMAFSNGETNSSAPSGLNLFTAAANNLATPSSTSDGGKSLSETSREFSLKEESLKTKYEEVQIVTGEEGEKNVIQMNCKLYGWGNSSWQERGRGILRLNDREIRDELHSRLVIRTQGTLTVMLNAKIWAEMSIEKPNDKTVRFTASDADGQPKIYLVMGSPKDITLLHNSLEYRVAAARSQTLDEKEREAERDSDALLPLSV